VGSSAFLVTRNAHRVQLCWIASATCLLWGARGAGMNASRMAASVHLARQFRHRETALQGKDAHGVATGARATAHASHVQSFLHRRTARIRAWDASGVVLRVQRARTHAPFVNR
jgi:hypothetical protein